MSVFSRVCFTTGFKSVPSQECTCRFHSNLSGCASLMIKATHLFGPLTSGAARRVALPWWALTYTLEPVAICCGMRCQLGKLRVSCRRTSYATVLIIMTLRSMAIRIVRQLGHNSVSIPRRRSSALRRLPENGRNTLQMCNVCISLCAVDKNLATYFQMGSPHLHGTRRDKHRHLRLMIGFRSIPVHLNVEFRIVLCSNYNNLCFTSTRR